MGSNFTVNLPGFDLPLNHTPDEDGDRGLFPNALDVHDIEAEYGSRLCVYREILMMRVMNAITDKPGWDRKVFNDQIVAKWREEIAASGQDVTPNMMDWIIAELQWKANLYSERGHIVAYEAGVTKSDSAISLDLKEALRSAVRPLEDVPEEEKDYHPGSDKKVVDLVHPSLFPVIYGRSRILPDRLIAVDGCLDSVGQGQLLAVPPESQGGAASPRGWSQRYLLADPFSRKFQWMPCDVEFTKDEGCRIVSYINNLHPERHRSLYGVIEKVLAKTIPLWNATLTNLLSFERRIPYDDVELEYPDSEPECPDDEDSEEMASIVLPEPGTFTPADPDNFDLRTEFAENGLQVIIKLANIELTPERPDYHGGSWHVEGQSNEHICATALYYYDSSNITENDLSFRQRVGLDDVRDVGYPQCRHEFLNEVFGFPPDTCAEDETNVTQPLGSVSTREGRLLTFPNILQHRVSPFSLADRSKPGHRKILAFFLVDPHIRIISSANIPPQNEDWWGKRHEVMDELMGNRLPVELQIMVNDNIDAVPITMDEAEKYRLELMEERSTVAVQHNKQFETGSFNLCEH